MSAEEPSSNTVWSREQEKAFENALADYDEDGNDRWQKIAADVPGKTADDVRQHFELLMEDISCIESGRVPLPNYVSSSDVSEHTEDRGGSKKCGHSGIGNGDSRHGGKSSRADLERRKGIAWTEDEHRLFLLGLEKYGKGDWRSISRNFVISRTPTQVASHAQKYFIRMNSMNKDRRRSSIHDITSVANAQKSPQGTTTGQTNGTSVLSSKSGKQTPLRSSAPAKVGVYETPTIGQPIGRPVVSAVGTPVHIPTPSHMVYGVHAPIAGTVVTGDPMVSAPMTYPMPHKSAKR